jgi:hypothetical protein
VAPEGSSLPRAAFSTFFSNERKTIMVSSLPSIEEIGSIVTEELAGGVVSDRCEEGDRLYLRTLLPLTEEVLPADFVRGGVAVMADETEIHVHPYLLRQVCRNGAVLPQLARARNVRRLEPDASPYDVDAVETELREVVRACSAAEVFSNAVDDFRMASRQEGDITVLQLLMVSSYPNWIRSHFPEIMRRFLRDDDRSMFGLVNAVTSTARDQRDPDARWRLEELGGGMLAMKLPQAKPGGSAAPVATRPMEWQEYALAGR